MRREQIRPDLKDIENTVWHFLNLADYFEDTNRRIGRFWNNGNLLSKISNDRELFYVVEETYSCVKDTICSLAPLLREINYTSACPNLKSYIDKIKRIQKNLIPDDRNQIAKCLKLIRKRQKHDTQGIGFSIDFYDIKEVIRYGKEALQILANLNGDISEIENSKRYKIENGLLPISEDQQPINIPDNSQKVNKKGIQQPPNTPYKHAYKSYCAADEAIEGTITDKQAYEWLKENGIDNYRLPAFETWARYLRRARKHYGTQKHTPRYGREHGRSIVSEREI